MIGDYMTKPLQGNKFYQFRKIIMGLDGGWEIPKHKSMSSIQEYKRDSVISRIYQFYATGVCWISIKENKEKCMAIKNKIHKKRKEWWKKAGWRQTKVVEKKKEKRRKRDESTEMKMKRLRVKGRCLRKCVHSWMKIVRMHDRNFGVESSHEWLRREKAVTFFPWTRVTKTMIRSVVTPKEKRILV